MKNLLTTLQDYKDRGLIFNQVHPTLPLTIWNYTPETQYGGHWDEITLMCRGIVTDNKGNIVARGFSKFFNIEEAKHEPTDKFEVFEKLDGSLILVFWYEGEMIVASRGSFTSPYALEAKRLLNEKYPMFVKNFSAQCSRNERKRTLCFELIGFEQIVVSYKEPDLLLTGYFFESNYGGWIDADVVYHGHDPYNESPKVVKRFDGLDWKNIKQLNWKNAEGFVVKFSNGSRCKIKFEDYIKLHRQMTNLSTRGIWEALAAGQPVSSILNDVPDEFYKTVQEYEEMLVKKYLTISTIHHTFFKALEAKGYTKTRKEFAEQVFALKDDELPVNPAVMFAIFDGKRYDKFIWKMVEPEYERL